MSLALNTDHAIAAWYESQSEESLRDLQDRFDAQTPRQAWEAFFSICLPPASHPSASRHLLGADPSQKECIYERAQCDGVFVGLVFFAEPYQLSNGVFFPFRVALSHGVPEQLDDHECQGCIDRFARSQFVQRVSKLLQAFEGVDLPDFLAHVPSAGGKA